MPGCGQVVKGNHAHAARLLRVRARVRARLRVGLGLGLGLGLENHARTAAAAYNLSDALCYELRLTRVP